MCVSTGSAYSYFVHCHSTDPDDVAYPLPNTPNTHHWRFFASETVHPIYSLSFSPNHPLELPLKLLLDPSLSHYWLVFPLTSLFMNPMVPYPHGSYKTFFILTSLFLFDFLAPFQDPILHVSIRSLSPSQYALTPASLLTLSFFPSLALY